jgi:hypothetical protein
MRTVTLELDDAIYAFLLDVPQRTGNSFTFNVNETVVTALRCLRGELPVALLVGIAASVQRVSGAEAMFGSCADVAETARLLDAAASAARGESL